MLRTNGPPFDVALVLVVSTGVVARADSARPARTRSTAGMAFILGDGGTGRRSNGPHLGDEEGPGLPKRPSSRNGHRMRQAGLIPPEAGYA